MTTRKYFPKFFSKNSESRRSVQVETSQNRENEPESGEFSGANTSKLHRSKSGRLKEASRVRLAIARDTFIAPENRAQSAAPAMSEASTRSGNGLAGRDLPTQENIRLSLSLQAHANSTAARDSSTTEARPTQPDSAYNLLDENEIF